MEALQLAPDAFHIRVDLSSKIGRIGQASKAGKGFDPSCGPVAHRAGIAGLARLLEILGKLFVLFQVGTRW
jgi:hypothetical protein